jgi:hypothetical protein
MKRILMLSLILMVGAGFAANDLSDPQFALAAFLAAVHDMSADRIWACLSPDYQQELEGNFGYMKENGDLGYFADTFKVPELLNCTGTYQMLSIALNRVPSANPALYQQTRKTFDLSAIYGITNRATYQNIGHATRVLLPDGLGTLSMVFDGRQWKMNDVSGFYIFQYYY